MNIPELKNLNPSNCTERSISLHYFEFWKYICDNFPKELKWTEKLYWYYNGLIEYPKCKVCGKRTKFINLKLGYREFCSHKCMNSCVDIQNRKRKTCQEHYGCDNPMHSEKCKEKLRQTAIDKFGVDNVFKALAVKEKIQKTNLKKRGYTHHMKDPLCVSKMLKTRNNITISRNSNIIDITDNFMYKMKCPHPECTKCVEKWYEIPNPNLNDRLRLHSELCTKLSPIGKYTSGTSLEIFVRGILDEYNIKYETNVRDVIPPQELDIYIPDKHIAIECNGIYWHSKKSTTYHADKYIKCAQKNIQLITLWEDWIINKPEIVESLLITKLGLNNNRVYARKCTVKEITPKISKDFLNNNHIQGSTNAHKNIGMFYNDELVAVMTFSKHRGCMGRPGVHDANEWELSRFCSKLNTRVVGGCGKMLAYFISKYNPSVIYSFSSHDISDGNLYKSLGFERDRDNVSYWYVDSSYKRYHRSAFTKQSIIKRGWKTDKDGWKEVDVMREHGYHRIYDSGQTKWVMRLK